MRGPVTGYCFDSDGWVEQIRHAPSPNCDARPAGTIVDLLVLHNISLPPGVFTGEAIVDFFTNRLDAGAHPYFASIADMRVSAHFLIRRDGETIQFVACEQRAWHAGQSQWIGRSTCNDYSIGIELEGTDDIAFSDEQYVALSALTNAIRLRYPIADIVGHSDIAPGRKTDPGPCFDWERFRAGLR